MGWSRGDLRLFKCSGWEPSITIMVLEVFFIWKNVMMDSFEIIAACDLEVGLQYCTYSKLNEYMKVSE